MAADLDLSIAKPRDMVELPSGRIGLVMAVLPDHRREIQYMDLEGGTVILPARLLLVRVHSKPKPWPTHGP